MVYYGLINHFFANAIKKASCFIKTLISG